MKNLYNIPVILTILFILSDISFAYRGYGQRGYGGNGNYLNSCIIIPLGIIAFISLIAALYLGYQRSGNKKSTLLWHRRFAIIAVYFTVAHVVSVILIH